MEPRRILYVHKDSSRYSRRFHQRRKFKQLLGRHYRFLVSEAKYHTKQMFLSHLTPEQTRVIRYRPGVEPGVFWRAVKGPLFIPLPPRLIQLELDFDD